jgi:cation:H+ antiporter
MVTDLVVFAVALFAVMRGATMATTYATRLATNLRLPTYLIGFLVIAVISILPETFISINAAISDVPEFGLGMLLGSNVADLTLIFALVTFVAGRAIKVERKILDRNALYPFILLLPIVLGLDGFYSRVEGAALVIAGAIFYYLAIRKKDGHDTTRAPHHGSSLVSFALLTVSLMVLLVGGHFIVSAATGIATAIGVSPIVIGMLFVSLGTTIPELVFSIKSVTTKDDALAIGDILGTVLADATIVVGVLALIHPFAFPKETIYIAGIFMVAAAFILLSFLRSGRILTRREAFALVVFWATFVAVQFIVSA